MTTFRNTGSKVLHISATHCSVCHSYTQWLQEAWFPIKSTPTPTLWSPPWADTGCQSCLMGIKLLRQLGLQESDLIPVSMKMHAANSINNIAILGAIILQLSGNTKKGSNLSTKQIVYVTDESDKFFLSRQVWMALGMISSFPLDLWGWPVTDNLVTVYNDFFVFAKVQLN